MIKPSTVLLGRLSGFPLTIDQTPAVEPSTLSRWTPLAVTTLVILAALVCVVVLSSLLVAWRRWAFVSRRATTYRTLRRIAAAAVEGSEPQLRGVHEKHVLRLVCCHPEGYDAAFDRLTDELRSTGALERFMALVRTILVKDLERVWESGRPGASLGWARRRRTVAVLRALVRIPGEVPPRVLVELAADGNDAVTNAALLVLGSRGDACPDAVQPLADLLAGSPAGSRLIWLWAARRVFAKSPEALTELVSHPSSDVRAIVASAAGAHLHTGGPGGTRWSSAVVNSLVKLAEDSEARVRRQACAALGRVAGESAVRQLFVALQDVNEEVQATAIASVASRKDRRVVPQLVACIPAASQPLKNLLAQAIESHPAAPVSDWLATLAEGRPTEQSQALLLLGWVGRPEMAAALVPALEAPEAALRFRAAEALAAIAVRAYPMTLDGTVTAALLRRLEAEVDPAVTSAVLDAIVFAAGEEALPGLLQRISGSAPAVRERIVETMALIELCGR